MIIMTFKQIKAATFGVARVEEKEGKIFLYRFTREQEEMYKNRITDHYFRTFATAGVSLEFDTDSENLTLSVEISDANCGCFFCHSIFVDGVKVGELSGEIEKGQKSISFNESFDLGEKYLKRVKILFPWSVCSVIKEIRLNDGSKFIPFKKKNRVIMFGDSITHGYVSEKPENSYASRIAEKLEADTINKGIGGEIFCPELAFWADDFEPDIITVAYGTNDWNSSSKRYFEQTSLKFFENLRKSYPKAKILALAPIWRTDINDVKSVGSLTSVADCFYQIAEKIDNMIVIDCIDFVPHDAEFYFDSVHPNDDGFKHYADGLWKEIKKNI